METTATIKTQGVSISHNIQGNSKGRWNRRPREKKIFNYRYKERLERNSVVGRLVEKKRLNNLVYVEYQSPPT